MEVVDAHVHVGLTKYVEVDVLVAQMDSAGIGRCLLVQYGGCHDNAYLDQCMKRYPGRFASLGAVDYGAADAGDRIRKEVKEYKLAGLRIPAKTENEAVWEAVGELGIMASLSGGIEGIIDPRTEGYIQRYPNSMFRIEHMGWFPDVDRSPDYPEFERVLSYSQYPNTVFMLSGFYAFGRGYPYREVEPFIEKALEAFGPERLMWGSDFPPVSLHETVEMALALPKTWPFVSGEDLKWILGGTANRILEFR
jgi:L-fuconolactonase